MKIKQGDPSYAKAVANAMDATDSLMLLTKSHEKGKSPVSSLKGNKKARDEDKSNRSSVNVDDILNIIETFANTNDISRNCNQGDIPEALLSALNSASPTKQRSNKHGKCRSAQDKALKVLESISQCIQGGQAEADNRGGHMVAEVPKGNPRLKAIPEKS